MDERQWAMGFHTNIIVMFGLSKRICRQILGRHGFELPHMDI